MTIFEGTFLDTPSDPFAGGVLRVEGGALLVRDGVVVARGSAADLRAAYGDDTVDLRGGLGAGCVLDVGLRNATDASDALGKAFALAGPGDIARVIVAGEALRPEMQRGGTGGP